MNEGNDDGNTTLEVVVKVVCAACRAKKKKCDGLLPCLRCRTAGKGSECVPSAQLPRGRPRKDGTKKRPAETLLESSGVPPLDLSRFVVPIDLHLQKLLSLMLQHGPTAIVSSTTEFLACFGVDIGGNYLVAQFMDRPSPTVDQRDPCAMLKMLGPMVELAVIKACSFDGSAPGMDDSWVGRYLGEIFSEQEHQCPHRANNDPPPSKENHNVTAWRDSPTKQFVESLSAAPGVPQLKVVDPDGPRMFNNSLGEIISAQLRLVIVFDQSGAPIFMIVCLKDAQATGYFQELTPIDLEMDTDWLGELDLEMSDLL